MQIRTSHYCLTGNTYFQGKDISVTQLALSGQELFYLAITYI